MGIKELAIGNCDLILGQLVVALIVADPVSLV